VEDVVVPVGKIAGFDSASTTTRPRGLPSQPFITKYHKAGVRSMVRAELQGMVDRGPP